MAKKKNDQKQNILRTTEVDQFLSKQELVQREDIDYVSTHLGLSWRDVGLRLGYSEGQLDHFYADNKDIGVKEVYIKNIFIPPPTLIYYYLGCLSNVAGLDSHVSK